MALHAVDHCSSSFTSQKRILRVVLEVAAAEGISHNVYTRCEQYVNAILFNLLTNRLTYVVDDFVIPGRCEVNTNRESCAVVGLRVAFAFRGDAQSCRAVGYDNSRNAESLDRVGSACCAGNNILGVAHLTGSLLVTLEACTYNEVCLLFEGQLLDDFIDVF